MNLLLFGLTWRAYSPSHFELAEQASVTMYFDGASWRLAFDGEEGGAGFASRDDAAYAIAEGIDAWMMEQLA